METTGEQNGASEETVQEAMLTETDLMTTEPMETMPSVALEAPELRGYVIPVTSLTNETALQAALDVLPADATHVFLPLKTEGGYLYYATMLEDVNRSSTVRAVMPLEDIYEIVSDRGVEPVAVVNALEDNVYPAEYSLAAYRLTGNDAVWKDAAGDNGKEWLSPFSDLTHDYLSELMTEMVQAGFTSFEIEGLRFPTFPESVKTQLDPACTAPDRYTALVNVIETMQAAAPDGVFYIGIDGMDALRNQADVLTASDQVETASLLVTVNRATQENTDLLRSLSLVHPTILVWDGIGVPLEESSFVQYMIMEDTPDAE